MTDTGERRTIQLTADKKGYSIWPGDTKLEWWQGEWSDTACEHRGSMGLSDGQAVDRILGRELQDGERVVLEIIVCKEGVPMADKPAASNEGRCFLVGELDGVRLCRPQEGGPEWHEYKCLGCGGWFAQDEVTWATPEGKLTMQDDTAVPWCENCLPDAADDAEDAAPEMVLDDPPEPPVELDEPPFLPPG